MNTFVNAVRNQDTVTENGMGARVSTANSCVDLFFKIGAMRGRDVTPQFAAAYAEDREKALRIALWARDIRGGAGEREIFRSILQWLEINHPEDVLRVLPKVPELGRWDDLLTLETQKVKAEVYSMIAQGLRSDNSGLVAKWMPRKGLAAVELRNYLGLSPKRYRKMLVEKTRVVETQMCNKDWENIKFDHVPSVASARYKKAFGRNAKDAYVAYLEGLKKGTNKVNASAVYPYDVIKTAFSGDRSERALITEQWKALPNYVGDSNILPMVDVSGSMHCNIAGNLMAIHVALSLGLYLADKNTGKFKNTFLTFSGSPELLHLKGDILEKMDQMNGSSWAMNTNIEAAFEKILDVAKKGNVPQSEMPEALLILSDMQFDAATHAYPRRTKATAMDVVRQKYADAGYTIPKIVFWNLNARDNVPVSFREDGTALVSGFSPAIMKSILSGKTFTPEGIMMEAIGSDRYSI